MIRSHLDISNGRLSYAPDIPLSEALQASCRVSDEICLVDLDAARGGPQQTALIGELARQSSVPILVSGGINSETVGKYAGIPNLKAVIVGSALFQEGGTPVQNYQNIEQRIGDHELQIAIDVSGHRIVTNGFASQTDQVLEKLLAELNFELGNDVTICATNADAALRASTFDISFAKSMKTLWPGKNLWVAGGVSSHLHIEILEKLGVNVAIGRAHFDESSELCITDTEPHGSRRRHQTRSKAADTDD